MASPEERELNRIADALKRIKEQAREALPAVAALNKEFNESRLQEFRGVLEFAGISTAGIKMPATQQWGGRYRRSYLESFGMGAAEQLPPYLQPYAAGALEGTAMPKSVENLTKMAGGVQNLQRVINAASTALGGMEVGLDNITKATRDANGVNFLFREGVNRTVISMDNLGNVTVKAARGARDFFDMVTRNIGKVIQWAIAVGLVYGALRKLSQVMEDMKEFQTLFADIAIVMGTSTDAATEYFEAMYEVSKITGTTVKDVAKSLDDALRVTADITDETERFATAEILLRDAMTLAIIANIDSVQAFDMLVGALRQTGYNLDQGTILLDKWVAVSRVAMTSVQDMAQGFAITAQAAQTAGVGVDQLSGMIAGMTEVTTLSATQAGNAIRAFMSSFTTERSVSALQQFGFAVKDLDGNYRSLWDILSEVAAAYRTGALSPTGLKEITDAIGGGYRRAAQVEALIKGWPKVQYAAAISMKAHGEAAEALGIKTETLQIAINRLTSAWQGFAEILMEEGLVEDITKVVDLMTKLLETITDLTDAFGPFVIRLGEIAALFGILSLVGSKLGFSMGMGAAGMATQMALPGMGAGMLAGAAAKAGSLAGPLALGGATIVPLVIEAMTEGLTDDVTWKTAGTLLGGAIGGVLTMGPWGVAIGAAIGQGIASFLKREQDELAIPLDERSWEWLLERQRELVQTLQIEMPSIVGGREMLGEDPLAMRRGLLEKELVDVRAAIDKKKALRRAGVEAEKDISEEYYKYIVQLEEELGNQLPDMRKRTLALLTQYTTGEITRAEYKALEQQLRDAYNIIFVAYEEWGREAGLTISELFEILATAPLEVIEEINTRTSALAAIKIELLRLGQEAGKTGLAEIDNIEKSVALRGEERRILEEQLKLLEMAQEAMITPPEVPPIFDLTKIKEEDLPEIFAKVIAFEEYFTAKFGLDLKDVFEESSYAGLLEGLRLVEIPPEIGRKYLSLVLQAWQEAMQEFDFRRIKDIGEMAPKAWFEKLTGLLNYYKNLFATLGYFPEEQEIIMMLGPQNEIFRIITSLDALRFAIEDLREIEERQLEGQWNLPAGAVAWVPITSLYYQRQQAAGLPTMPGVPEEPVSPGLWGGRPFDISSRFGAAKWEDLIYQYATAAGIDPRIIAAILQLESAGRPSAVGAQTPWGQAAGLMQIMPFHAWRLQPGESLYDPEANIRIGVEIFRELLERYEGDVMKAVAGYYGGVLGGQISPAGEDYLKVFREAFSNLFGTGILTAEGMPTGAVTQNIIEIPPIEIPPIYGEFTIHNYIVLEGAIIERFVNRILAEALTRYRRSGGTSGAGGPSRI